MGELTEIEGVTGRDRENDQRRDGPFENVRANRGTKWFRRRPEARPRQYALSPAFSNHTRSTNGARHHVAECAECNQEIKSANAVVVAEDITEPEARSRELGILELVFRDTGVPRYICQHAGENFKVSTIALNSRVIHARGLDLLKSFSAPGRLERVTEMLMLSRKDEIETK